MMQAVPTADVVIRNPTHVAVALKYDISSDRAPILVAKGVDHTALKIVEVAMDSHVEIIENVSVAKLYIPLPNSIRRYHRSFMASWRILMIYIYQLKGKKG